MKKLIIILILLNIYSVFSQQRNWSEPQNFTVVNSKYNEFAPVWNKFTGELFFNSDKSGYSKFYFTRNDDNNWKTAQLVEGEINSDRSNQSYIAFESREVAYLSAFREFKNRSYLNIFQTRKKKNQWLKPFKLDSLELPVFMGHPTVSPDGTMLIFSSDYNSEFGDTDLWMAFKQDNGSWGALIRINQIQSPGNEITPFLASNDTLYFASDGQEGPGGYDIFMSVRVQGIWQMPYPITEINTEFDESDFTLLPDGSAVFASNRPGGLGELDLYIVNRKIEKIEEPVVSKVDFSIEAQVPFIKVEGESIRKTILINTGFFYDSTYFSINDDDGSNKNNNLKFLERLALREIKKRLQNKRDINLNCTIYFSKRNEQEIKNITEKINNFFSDSKLIINSLQMSRQTADLIGNSNYYLKFKTNDASIFEPLKLDITPLKTILPPALDLSIDARPRDHISSWKMNILIANEINDEIKNGTELPFNFYHSIKQYANELNKYDSLILKISAKDANNNSYDYSQILSISHSDIEDDGVVISNGKSYTEYFMNLFDEKELSESLYSSTIKFLAKEASSKKKIIINYYSDKALTKVNSVKNILSELINNSEIAIILQKDENYNNFIPNNYQNIIFKIQVEI